MRVCVTLKETCEYSTIFSSDCAACGMPTIFQLSRDDLASLLHFLRPDADFAALQDAAPAKLRPQITEWLLINGLSTMHQFVRDENNEWTMPDKTDCISCGRYKVGGTPKVTPQPIVEEPEPLYITEQKLTYHLPAMDIPYALTHNDNMIIRTKSHEDKVVVTYPGLNNNVSARSDYYESTKSECCTDCGRCMCSPVNCPMRKKTTSWFDLFSYLSCRRVVTQ
uniref:Zf-AD domain-containing protein n=1 Tax=Steinernema glaseri TaxID=37863 RepID=A0A1I7YW69_9BILA